MKDLKLKDVILEHYRKVYETEMDGFTVRVWKPVTMSGKLPTYGMGLGLRYLTDDAKRNCIGESKVKWLLGNPDYGAWDAQLVRRIDQKRKTLDIYFAALLIRPFSKQAYDWYEAHCGINDPVARLCLMWDSRDFDRKFGYDTSFGKFKNWEEFAPYLYNGKRWDTFDPIEDPKFDRCPEFEEEGNDTSRRCVKLKAVGGEFHYEAVEDADEEKVRGGTLLMHDCSKAFFDFRKEHPEVTEMHFYTDEVLSVEE